MLNLLTGPVNVRPQARQAMLEDAAPHRSPDFLAGVAATRRLLCRMTGASHAQLLLGSGTLANDVVAGQLSLRRGRGVVLSNGEFGDRLVDHAARFGLDTAVLRWPWGHPIDQAAVARHLATHTPDWLWCTHLETSTGVLNDTAGLARLAAAHGTALCLDTISALGLVPLDLRHVLFASGVSGKGLRGYPGLAIVFHNHAVAPAPPLPRYLDLGLYTEAAGVPFTHSSNLVGALRGALQGVSWRRHYGEIRRLSVHLRASLRAAGFAVVAAETDAAPGIVTVALPDACPSAEVSTAMERLGVRLGAGSDYLRGRNWIQFSLMSRPPAAGLDRAVRMLVATCAGRSRPAPRRLGVRHRPAARHRVSAPGLAGSDRP